MTFPTQIHIIFNARERDRIIQPLLESNPNKVYYFYTYIRQIKQKDINMDFYEDNCNILKEKLPSLEIIEKEVDYTNYIEIIQEVSKIIRDERKENPNTKIYINVSSGSKMTALASGEAAKLWNCDIYYVYASEYDPVGSGPRHKGKMYIITPITFPIEKPSELYIWILKIIEDYINSAYSTGKIYDANKKKYISKKILVEKLYDEGLIKLEKKNEDQRKLTSSLYMKCKTLLSTMANDLNYIEISDDKRNKRISLTETGQNILEIFKYLI